MRVIANRSPEMFRPCRPLYGQLLALPEGLGAGPTSTSPGSSSLTGAWRRPAEAAIASIARGHERGTALVPVRCGRRVVHNSGVVMRPPRVLLETFSYTRHGAVDGTEQSISADTVSDEKLGPILLQGECSSGAGYEHQRRE